ncbi:WXG100 family type VII secretion target [Mycobacteroides abscessus]|uniref:WXG100 family type VII secretion target n=1 Tax=Mycobacteroides abscessus TaxID=36809 RepID=UPI001F258D30|nr:WXG100 family type VII secretion target [Mycobacteroides abscessus]
MSLSIGELKKVSVQSIRDIATGLRAKAASMRATQAGVTDLPHKGTWTGVAADNADHEIGTFAKGVGNDANAYENAAKNVDRAGDEFEGLKQLLAKLENEAAGKFSINEATGEVTPLTKDFNKSDRDYIANTIKQLCAAGGQANDDLAAGIHATDASGATSPAGAAGAMPDMPGSAIKPEGSFGALQNLAAPNPDGDPGATRAAAAGADTEAKYKDWYPKNAVPVGDKNVDPGKLGGVGSIPGVRDAASGREPPAKLAPALQGKDVPAFKAMTREVLTRQGVPADQIESRVNAAVESAQNPRLVRTDVPSASPTDPKYISRDFGEQFNRFTNGISDSATKTVDGQIEQAKILTGQAGPGAPGVSEAWKEIGLNAARQAHELTTDPLAAPKMGIEQAKDFYNNPSEFIGKNIIYGTEALATGGVGGEAAAGARGLLGDLTGAEGHAITHGIDSPHPAPTVQHPGGGIDHPAPGVGPDHAGPNTGSWNHSTEHYSPQAPQLAADLNNAFTNGHVTSDLAGQVADHSTHHAPGIGSTANPDRVVLGKWDGQDGGYIGEARHNGGIYFDTGDETWNAVGRGLPESQAKALGWQVNEQFLRAQLENHVSRIDYVLDRGKFSTLEDVVIERAGSYSAMEIEFLTKNAAAYGYERIGDSWVLKGGR